MGNEISTVGGAIGVAGTAVAAGVCFGKCETLNKAVVETSKFTANQFMDSTVRHVGEAACGAVAVTSCAIASGVCLGQVEPLNQAVVKTAEYTATTGRRAAIKVGGTLNDATDSIPVVGHVKGGIHYAFGDKNGGDQAMKLSSRTVGVLGGGAAGFLVAGPVGAVAGGIAGGAALDGITTVIDSAVHDEYRPAGQVAAWTSAANGKSTEEVIGGIVGIVVTPVMDGIGGYAAGKMMNKINTARAYRVMDTTEADVAVKQQKLSPAHNQGGVMGETSVSKSVKHSKTFMAERAESRGGVSQSTVQINADARAYSKIRSNAIPQKGSRIINQQLQSVKNVFNTERLKNHPKGKVNLIIKGSENLKEFNKTVKSIKVVDPVDLAAKGGMEKTVGRYAKASVTSTTAETATNATTRPKGKRRMD